MDDLPVLLGPDHYILDPDEESDRETSPEPLQDLEFTLTSAPLSKPHRISQKQTE